MNNANKQGHAAVGKIANSLLDQETSNINQKAQEAAKASVKAQSESPIRTPKKRSTDWQESHYKLIEQSHKFIKSLQGEIDNNVSMIRSLKSENENTEILIQDHQRAIDASTAFINALSSKK